MLTVAPRIVNDVSYVMWINHELSKFKSNELEDMPGQVR